jgi:sugar-specific transcriptional regulator TrmB
MITYKQIIEFGLDEKEARVFLAALEMGGESVLAIAKKAGINRVATYEALETLIKRGLVSTFVKGKRVYYSATEPDRLEHLLEQEKQEIDNKENVLNRLMPELMSLYNSSNKKPKVMYYEGKAGLRTIQSSFLKTPDKTLRLIFFYDVLQKVFSKQEMEDYRAKRNATGIKVKSIAVVKDKDIIINEAHRSVDRVYIKYEDFPMKSDITIYGDKIAFVSLNELFGIVIENEELANTMKSFFDLALNIAKKETDLI